MRRAVLVAAIIAIAGVVVGAAVVLYQRQAAYQQRKETFIAQYQSAMIEHVHKYYALTRELPTDYHDAIDDWCLSPDAFHGVSQFGMSHPTMDESWPAFPQRMFHEVLPKCAMKSAQWEEEIQRGQSSLRDCEGDLSAQLELLTDAQIDVFAALRFLGDLERAYPRQGENISSYWEACKIVRFWRTQLQPDEAENWRTSFRESGSEEFRDALHAYEFQQKELLEQLALAKPMTK